MENEKKKLPIGIENFADLIKDNFYYIDKTGLIRQLLTNWGAVNLFTRPRRFGKTLNMSMLESFFSLESDKQIFQGLEISKEKKLCEEYMGKFPVISISLKGLNGRNFEHAFKMAIQLINAKARSMQFLLQSNELTETDKMAFSELLKFDMDESTLECSLKVMSELLHKHYGQQVILLIDEYDVPLAKAFEQGYYDQMVILIRNLFEQVLKTNSSMKFAVLTGCMRISKESIFTGLNNLNVLTIADVEFDEYYGFTDAEVRKLLEYYNLSERYEEIKAWYDGYQFGNVEVYCPWDVVCHCKKLRTDVDATPQNYWINTSSNDAVKHFIEMSDNGTTRREIEKLVAGDVIIKEIRQELTYKEMYQSIDNIWSVLFTTGYLTQRGKPEGNRFKLAIPNLEIRSIYTEQIMSYFKKTVQKNGEMMEQFCDALQDGNAELLEKILSDYLKKTISIRDTFVKKPMKENFYHGILLGILGFKDGWGVTSNKEAGNGYSDIIVEDDEAEFGIIIEVKYAENGELESTCRKALRQIENCKYDEELRDDGIDKIMKYGIACYKKRCKVLLET